MGIYKENYEERLPVKRYYERLGSKLGYKWLLHGAQHFAYYPDDAPNTTEAQAQYYHHNLLAQSLGLPPESTVLDAGCGQGIVAADLAQRYGLRITGIDIVPYIIHKAEQQRQRLEPTIAQRLQYHEMSYNHITFADNSFDGVYTVETLCHSPDLQQSLHELYRVLKPGGRAVFFEYQVVEHNEFSPRERRMYNIVKEGSAMFSLDQFCTNNFRGLLYDVGFTNITEEDISHNAQRSFYRLYRIARYPYIFINLLGLHRHFINATAGVEYYKMAEKGCLNI